MAAEAWWDGLRYDANGLVPVVAADAASGAVLMLAWADREALARTAAERRAWFWSRSRREYWRKGDTSGHAMEVVELRWDCDADAVLYRVRPAGPACHTGETSCFYRGEGGAYPPPPTLGAVLDELAEVVAERRRRRPEGSYVARLLAAGRDRALQKVGEEGVEVVIAGLGTDRSRVVSEAADLLFHTLVALAACDVEPAEVAAELRARVRPVPAPPGGGGGGAGDRRTAADGSGRAGDDGGRAGSGGDPPKV